MRPERLATAAPPASATRDWITVQGGDGSTPASIPPTPNIIYAESQDGNLLRRNLKTSRIQIHPPAGRQRHGAALPLPVELAARRSRRTIRKTIYYGGNHLFKSTDRGDTWVAARRGPHQ